MLSVAKAVGFRSRNQQGEAETVWTDHDGNALVLTAGADGVDIGFLLLFDLPRASRVVRLSVPALMEDPVALDR